MRGDAPLPEFCASAMVGQLCKACLTMPVLYCAVLWKSRVLIPGSNSLCDANLRTGCKSAMHLKRVVGNSAPAKCLDSAQGVRSPTYSCTSAQTRALLAGFQGGQRREAHRRVVLGLLTAFTLPGQCQAMTGQSPVVADKYIPHQQGFVAAQFL